MSRAPLDLRLDLQIHQRHQRLARGVRLRVSVPNPKQAASLVTLGTLHCRSEAEARAIAEALRVGVFRAGGSCVVRE